MRRLHYSLASASCWVLVFANLCSSQEKGMRDKPGTTSQEQATRATIDRFNEAFNRHECRRVGDTSDRGHSIRGHLARAGRTTG